MHILQKKKKMAIALLKIKLSDAEFNVIAKTIKSASHFIIKWRCILYPGLARYLNLDS